MNYFTDRFLYIRPSISTWFSFWLSVSCRESTPESPLSPDHHLSFQARSFNPNLLNSVLSRVAVRTSESYIGHSQHTDYHLPPLCTELVIISNIFIAMLYLCDHAGNEVNEATKKALAQYAMIPAITSHIMCEISSSPGGTMVISRVCYKDCAYMAPSPLEFILRTRKIQLCPSVTAPRIIFLLPWCRHLVMKMRRTDHRPKLLCTSIQFTQGLRDMTLEGNVACLGFRNKEHVGKVLEYSQTWLCQKIFWKRK